MLRTLGEAGKLKRFMQIIMKLRQLPWWQKTGLILVVVVALQQFIPAGWVSPRSQLDHTPVSWTTASGVSQLVANRQAAMRLTIGQDGVEIDSQQAGIGVDVEATVRQLPTLGYGWRLVPFGPVVHGLRGATAETVVHVDDQKLQAYAVELAKKYTYAPVDAKVEIKDGALKITPAKQGQQVDAGLISAALKRLPYQNIPPAVIVAEHVSATTTDDQAAEARKTYDSLQSTKLAVTFGDTTKTYDAATFNKWLMATQDSSTKQWKLQFTAESLAAPLAEWQKAYSKPAGVTQVTMVDGVVTSRVNGASGRKLNEAELVKQLNSWIQKPSSQPVQLATQVVSPRIAYTRTYTRSSAALQAKINDWVAAHRGSYQIAVLELGGQGRTASYNVSQQTVMASTYKLFVAYAIYHQAEEGLLNLSTVVHNGQTIEQCISKSIVYSDNDCAIALGRYIGWAKADDIVHAAGFQYVFLNNYDSNGNLKGDKLVNANELAKFLAQLSAGSLMNSTNTNNLLSYMKRQVYRQGIPAGSHGAVVADKVGFLESYLHDAGIVYGPNSTYALVIMSSGSSWSSISNLADAIYSFMLE